MPIQQKVGYGFGSVSQVLGSHSITNLANFVFNIGLGVSPVLVGLAQSIPRLWDAFTDPLMGHISDNTRSRWGRRRPFLFIGAILMGILFALIWCLPEGWSEKQYFYYFLGMSLLYYTAFTIFMVPWGALGLELTEDYHERTRIQAMVNVFGNFGAFAMPWLSALTQLDFFESPLQGARVVGICMGLVLMICGLVPFFLCRETEYKQAVKQPKIGFWNGFKATCSNRVFMQLMTAVLLASFGFFTISTISPYVIIYYVMGGDVKASAGLVGANGTAWVLSAICFVAPVTWFATKFGKKTTFLVFTGVHFLGHFIKIWCYNPAYPYGVIIPPIFISAGFVSLWVMGAAMTADICDDDEMKTGARREGSYQSVFGWILKMGMALSSVVGGALLNWTGFDEALEMAQTPEALIRMRVIEAGVPMVAIVIAFVVACLYPLSENQVYETREKLNERGATDDRLA